MHSSALRTGQKFIENYFHPGMKTVLEIGSYDVNGSLRQFKPTLADWIGVDIEQGPGVDLVIQPGQKLPFNDDIFDLVIASSVFEHDPEFWKTIQEMARVCKVNGFIYISSPSNGAVHRYPLDCFRFYPDASQSLVKAAREAKPNAYIVESFIGDQDAEEIWNDFVAVFSCGESKSPVNKIYKTEKHKNVWDDGLFLEDTYSITPEDRQLADLRLEKILKLEEANRILEAQLEAMINSKRWKLTSLFGNAIRSKS